MTKLNKTQPLSSHREHLSQSSATSAAYQRYAVCCWARRDSNQKDYQFGLWSLPQTVSKTKLDGWKYTRTARHQPRKLGRRSRNKEEDVQALWCFCRATRSPGISPLPKGQKQRNICHHKVNLNCPLCPGSGSWQDPPANGMLLTVEEDISSRCTCSAEPGLA